MPYDPAMQVLYGPPGTGKTWHATRRAVRVIDPATNETDIPIRHQELVNSGQIVWVTFHPSFSYEDFIEGFRPETNEKGILYTPRPGPFRIACNNVTLAPPTGQVFFVGQTLASSTGNIYDVVSASIDSVVVKNVKDGKGSGLLTPVSLHVVERLKDVGFKPGDLSLPGTAHERKTEIAAKAGFDMQTLFGMTGPLRAVWEHADSTTAGSENRRPVVLVIDEINRADLSRVFGDVITLIEADKRLGRAEEKRIVLPYSQIHFGVPQELNIIGTMNTSDRSLSVMDLALRRRFDFIEIPPDTSRCALPYGATDLRRVLAGWNRALSALLGREKQLGHSYFEQTALERVRGANGFANDDDGQRRAIASTIRQSILPLFIEMFRGDWRQVDFVFGRNFETDTGGLLASVDDSPLRDRAGGQLVFLEIGDFVAPNWWDPHSADWNANRFVEALNRPTVG